MDTENCKGCEYIGIPTYLSGRKNGILYYTCNEESDFCSCCHPLFNGGVQLSYISKCPKIRGKK
jgi:hypothetical protein